MYLQSKKSFISFFLTTTAWFTTSPPLPTAGLVSDGPGGSTTIVTWSAPLLMYLNKYLIEPAWLHHSTLM